MNQWNGDFYNALQKLDGAALYQLIKFFVVLVSGLILVVVLGTYFRQKLAIRWREGMTEQILSRWLSPQSRHYLLRLTAREPDNPDQRIAEDVRLLVESTLSLLITFLHSLLTLISFAAILWQLSGSILLSVAGTDWRIDGYMFWACIAYTLVGIALTQLIGGPLRKLNMEKQQREADYRAALITRRQHGDAIAGQRGSYRINSNCWPALPGGGQLESADPLRAEFILLYRGLSAGDRTGTDPVCSAEIPRQGTDAGRINAAASGLQQCCDVTRLVYFCL